MDVFRIAEGVSVFALRTSNDLNARTKRLSTGLRINSAADDPSGLAISERARALSEGYQQGQRNVADAQNALNVADAALAEVTAILQRIRALTIQANTDITSLGDRQNIQAEIKQHLLEINAIAQRTQFNGKSLLDGSLAAFHAAVPGQVVEVQAPLDPVTGGVPRRTVVNATGSGAPGTLISNPLVGFNVPSSYFSIQVVGYDPVNAIDPITGPIGGPGLYVKTTQYSPDPAFGVGVAGISAIPVSAGLIPGVQLLTGNGLTVAITFDLANLTAQDVGAAQAFYITPGVPQHGGTPLAVNFGPSEGATLAVSIDAVSTNALGISNITVLPPMMSDGVPGDPTQTYSSSQLSAGYAEHAVGLAIDQVIANRATLGAQMGALEGAQTDDGITATNLTASQSHVADADIGRETAALVKDQIINSFQMSMLSKLYGMGQNTIDMVRFSGKA